MNSSRNPPSPPGGGRHSYDPSIVKGEKSEEEKIYMITEISEILKTIYGQIFPLNPPQRASKLKQMFSAPRGVQPNRRINSLYTSLITDFDSVMLNSLKDYGPSPALEKSFIHKDIHPDIVESMKNEHCRFAMLNMKFVKVKTTLVLILDPHHMISKNPGDQIRNCVLSSRRKWLAANLILFPTSPQVIAAQIVRNHARVFSEEKSTNAHEYQAAVKKLMVNCHGLSRALTPERDMPMLNHLGMSWHRIRKRVLEGIRDAANKVTPQTERAFFSTMPFELNTIPKLMEAIRHQLKVCEELWQMESGERIELSDGPDVEEEMEEEETMDGRMEEDEDEEEREGRGMRRETVHRAAPSLSMQQSRQNMGRSAPSREMGPSSSRMQSYTKNDYHGRQQTNGGDTRGTLASMLPPQQSMARSVMNGLAPSGSGISIPPSTPTSSNGGTLKMTLRKDENQRLFVHSSPSASPSTSSTHTAVVPIQNEQTQSIPHAPPPPPPQPPTTRVNEQQQPLAQAPSTAAVENGEEKEKEEERPPPMETVRTPRPISNGSSLFGGMTHSPLFSSPQLLWMGLDGVVQPIPSIVYVEQTEHGLRQVNPPTPLPQIAMAIPSVGGGSGRSGSNKRRLSRESIVKRKRMEYGDSGDASSEDSDKEVKKMCQEKEKMVEERRRKREDRKKVDNARKEEEENRKKHEEEERKKKEEDERRKKEEEEERKKIEEEEERKKLEEEMRKKEAEMERQKKEENERVELERLREEDELMKTRSMEGEEESRNEENESEEQEEVRVLAEDSTEERDENEDNVEEERECEDEVVAESVVDQSENEEKEEEKVPSTVSTTNEISNGNVEKSMDTERIEMNGVAVSSSHRDEDNDIEFVCTVVGQERQMSKGYCEIVKESINMKKELTENGDNEVIYIEEKKGTGKLPSRRKSMKKETGTLKGWIKEGAEKVKEEEHNDVDDNVKKEVDEESMVACRGGVDGEAVSDTRLSDVKSEVNEEEEIEKEDVEIEKTMVDRNGGNEETRDETMHRSNDDECEEDEEMERRRIILEAMTQEEPSQIPLMVAHSDESSEMMTAIVPSVESIPMDSITNRMEEAISIQSMDTPQETPISLPISNALNESPPEMIAQSVPSLPHESLPPPMSNQSLSTPPHRPSSIRVASQSREEERGRIPSLSTRLSAQMIEILHKSDSLTGSYFDKQGRREREMEKMKETENEKEKEKEKGEEKETEVITEEAMNDSDGDILRFHSMRGIAAKLSDDRRCAVRDESINSCSMAIVFTNRPIRKGEKVTLKVMEVSPEWKGRIRLGLTTKDPVQYASRNEVPRNFNSLNEDGHSSYIYDSGCLNAVEMGCELEVELTEKGDELMYSFNGKEMGLMGRGIQVSRPMWLVVDVYGYVRSIKIIDNVVPPMEENGEAVSSDHVHPLNYELNDPGLKSVKEEMTEEEPAHPSQSSHSPVEKDIESALQSCVMIVHAQIESMNENGRNGEMPNNINENLSIDTVPTESRKDTVERGEEEEEREMNAVAITEEVMVNEMPSREEKEEGETVERVEMEMEEVSIEPATEDKDENDEPPIKKMRIEQEVSEVMMEDSRKDVENDEEGEEEKFEDRGENEEKNEENEDNDKSIVESMIEVIPMASEEEMVPVEVIGMKEDTELGRKDIEENEEEVIEKGENEDEKMKTINETMENDGRTENTEEVMDNEMPSREEENEGDNGTVERVEMEEVSIETATEDKDENDEPPITNEIVEEDEEEKEAKEEWNKKEKNEEEESFPLAHGRRSLFGPGCLSFECTFEAKEKSDNRDEKDEKMEVDETEKQEKADNLPIRRLSLFGPGSASFKNIMENMKK